MIDSHHSLSPLFTYAPHHVLQRGTVSHLLPTLLLFTSSSKLTLPLIHRECQWTFLTRNLRHRHARTTASYQARRSYYLFITINDTQTYSIAILCYLEKSIKSL